ncbi:MAG TPA: hypothetical protein VLC09_04145 [Polyangiaceae bacterium]|nr:hypothetical protein [Polyangiaceae bacterium]
MDDAESRAVFEAVLLPFTLPYRLAQLSEPSQFAPRLFARGCGAFCPVSAGQHSPSWRAGVAAEGGADLDGGMAFAGLELRLDSAFGLGVAGRLQGFREPLESGPEYALLGKSHLVYRFATFSHVQFYGGLGPRWYVAPSGSVYAGVDLLYALHIQLLKPLVAEFEFDLANVGASFAPEIRGTLGLVAGPVEFYAGWDQHWIGDATLGGPVGGLRVHF